MTPVGKRMAAKTMSGEMARSGSGLSVVFACISPRFWHLRTRFATRNVSPKVSPLAMLGYPKGVARLVPGNLAGECPVVTQGSPLGPPKRFVGTGVGQHILNPRRARMGHPTPGGIGYASLRGIEGVGVRCMGYGGLFSLECQRLQMGLHQELLLMEECILLG